MVVAIDGKVTINGKFYATGRDLSRETSIYIQVWWSLYTGLVVFIYRFGGLYIQVWWSLYTGLVVFMYRFLE